MYAVLEEGLQLLEAKPFLLIRAQISYNEEEGPYGYSLIVRPSDFSTLWMQQQVATQD